MAGAVDCGGAVDCRRGARGGLALWVRTGKGRDRLDDRTGRAASSRETTMYRLRQLSTALKDVLLYSHSIKHDHELQKQANKAVTEWPLA